MSPEPTESHDYPKRQQRRAPQHKSYTTDKLRAFVVQKQTQGTTRLILRERKGIKPSMRDVLFYYLFIERQHFVMVRRMLLGIKDRAERAQAVRMVESS